MKHELIDKLSSRIGQARQVRRNWMQELFPGQSPDAVADQLIRMAGEIELAGNRAW